MVSLVLRHGQHYPQVSTQGTHAVDVASGTLPLRISITAVLDLLECVLHIFVQLGILLKVQLETPPMALRVTIVLTSVSCLGSACYDQSTVTGILESDRAFHSARQESTVGCATRVVLGRTAT